MTGDVPGNMALELEQPRALTRIVFCDERVRSTVTRQYPGAALALDYLSHLGQFAAKPDYDLRRAFTLTNSDELPGLAELLQALPDVTFAVGALTLMSDKLHDIGRRYPNLILIPTINHRRIGEELERASVYLDINAGPHVLDVVTAAYHLDLLVLALARTAKAPDRARVFDTVEDLGAELSAAASSAEARARALDALHRQHGPLSTPEDYRRILG